MRTVKRQAKPLNAQKQKSLEKLCQAYTREKKYWLRLFQSLKSQVYLARPRTLRDEMIKKNYRSTQGLQARHWKLALEEAAEIWDKYWRATFVKVRSKISRRKNLSEQERHYAFWLLKGYAQFAALMQGKYPEPKFAIEHSEKKRTAAWLRGLVKKCKGKTPTIKKARSVRFDAEEKKTKNTNLRKYNLGKKKQRTTKKRAKTTLEKEINTAINQLIRTRKPSMVITEDLHHTFRYDKPKKVNRKMSGWLRGTLQDRMSFKALAEGFRHEQVNPAYGSQSCPYCEFVDPQNRVRDRFLCLHCGHEDTSDRIAALNYARRIDDHEIGLYTPYREVKTILLDRFHRRLETGQPVTVPGRTLETVGKMNPPSLSRHHVIARSENAHANWTVTQRAKQKINTF